MTSRRHINLKSNTEKTNQYFDVVVAQLDEGQAVRLAFGGTSMLPTLHASDTLQLEPLRHDDTPAVGDVLLFRHNGMYIVHRLIAFDNGHYMMQGDNNYGTEETGREDLIARVTAVEHADGSITAVGSSDWSRHRCRALRRSATRRTAVRWLGRQGRRQLRPWYFSLLAILMWAPLNGLGVPLDNYIFGLRADHLLHASVFLPCAFLLWDLLGHCGVKGRKWAVWVASVVVGLISESVQYLLPWRGFDINDLVANTFGITLGWVALLLVRRFRHK